MPVKKNPTIIDLFSGAGGLSFGLQEAGFRVLLGTDFWEDSLITFAHNHKKSKTIKEDILKVKSNDISKLASKKVSLIVGGPPCQGFSLSGPRNFYDKRNKLYIEFLRIVRDLKPNGFLIENVPGLASLFGGKVKDRIISEFSKLGYSVNAKILNASDYGVPQNRKRIVFVGLKGGKKFEFPEPTYFDSNLSNVLKGGKKKITVWEAIGDLPLLDKDMGNEEMPYTIPQFSKYQKLMRKGSRLIYNHVASCHKKRTIKIISLVPEGGNYKNLPDHLKNSRNFHVAWTRLHREKLSPTMDTGHRHHFHPTANRVPTVRECARIQSFPDKFIFLGTKTSQQKQVGNAVPPLLSKIIGKKLIKYF